MSGYLLVLLSTTYVIVAAIGTDREILSTVTTLELPALASDLLRGVYWIAALSLWATWLTGNRIVRSLAQGITFGIICARMLGAAQSEAWIIVAFLFGFLVAQVHLIDTAVPR